MPRNDLIQLRQGIENQWSFANPVLESGEPGYATDTKILKIGDGINGWNSLSSVSQLDVVYTTGDQSIGGTKTFTSQPVFNNGILVGGTSRFTIGGGGFDFSIDRGFTAGSEGDALKFDVDQDNGAGYVTTLQTYAPTQNIIIRLPNDSGVLALDKRNMIAGSGLVGGGTISADRTFNIGQGDGITVSADAIAVDSNVVVRTTGSQNISGTKTFNNNVIVTGQFSAVSGYFKNYLSLNGTGVSISGHTHTVSDITNFNSSVSGLLPVKDIIAGSGIQVGAVSGAYTITAFGVATSSASSLITEADNKTGSTISKMSVVYINGGHGNRPTIQKSIASTESTSSKTYGITASDINDNQTGDIIIFGELIDVNTDQFGASLGSTLYLSPSISGGITATKPLAPNHLVTVGKIIRNHTTQGIIEVTIQNGFELYELHDVAVTGATDGQFLQYNSNSGLWTPSSSGNFSTLLVNNTGVSITGHTHQIYEINNLQSTLNNKQPTGSYVSLTGIESVSGTKTFLNNVIVTGQFSSVSGYFKNYLSLNGSGVSITGHSHTVSDITNFNSGVSGIVPVVTGTGSIQVLFNNNTYTVNVTGLPLTGHRHPYTDIDSFCTGVAECVSTPLLAGTGIVLSFVSGTGLYIHFTGGSFSISNTGISAISGYFRDYLSLNGSGISLTGHTHTVSDITNFNSGVSGLFPSTLVYTTGTQIITGNKDFGSNLKISASQVTSSDYFPTFGSNNPLSTSYALQYITKADLITSLSFETINVGNSFVSTTGTQQISGVKTFLSTSSFNGNNSTISSRNSRLMPIGNIMLENSNTNFIVFNDAATGLAPVNSTVFSSGLKILFKPLPSILGSAPPVAMGISNNALWHVVPANNWQYQWNALSGTIATLFGDGTFNATNISGTNFYLSGTKINSSADDLNLLDTATNGQLLIGSGLSFSKSTLTAGTGISIDNGSGTITINTVGLQSTLTNPITGTGTNGKLSKWSSTSTLTDSIMSESSTVININGSFNGNIDDTFLSFDAGARRIGMTKKGGFTGKFTYGSGSSFAIAQSNSGTIEASHTFTDRLVIDTNGNVGIGTATPTYKLQVNGNFGATTKSFRIDHPSKSGYSLEYGSLESPYHGVRLTGRGKVIKGVGVVSVPSYLKDLIYDDNTLNIQITNIKHGKTIYLEEIDLENDRFIVKADKAKTLADLEFFWTLTGVRKDVDHLVVEKEK